MRKLIVITLFLAGCGGNTRPDEDAIRKSITGYFEGVRLHDTDLMVKMTTSDFILYEAGQVWNNDSVFREMGKYPYKVDYIFSDFDIIAGEERAYANYRAVADFVFQDSVREHFDFVENAFLEKQGGTWKIDLLQVCDRLTRYDTIYYAKEYYDTRRKEFKKEKVETGGMMMVGNSIIEFGNWRRLLGDSSVTNRGIAADNTYGVLNRLEDITSCQPGKVFIETGINDLSQNIPVNLTIGNIRKMVRGIRERSQKTKIYIVSLLPTNEDVAKEYPNAYNKNRLSALVNEQLKMQAKDGGYIYLDLNSKLADDDGNLDRKFATPDGLHLNNEGYKKFAELVEQL